ncbi:hypothetical protein V6N12_020273 [Hibiscus sabdariffa]|uniref:Uncharacterized protein n=1 Tax=Hibiscus sabdariffa TaxID=183260 RepID=A0ABR2BUH2_9ROSI
MPVCSCAARLAGGGWDSGVFGAAVWQPHGGFRQFCWLHRDGLVQFRWQNRGGPVQSRWQHHGDPMQFRWQHRGGPVQFRGQHRLARMPPGMLFQSLLSRGKSRLCAPLALFVASIGAWLWPPLGRCPPLQHSCATRSPRSDVGLPCALLAWPAEWACSSDVVGITGAGMMVWCASSGTPMPLLATMFVTALVVGSTLSRPVTVAGAVLGCLAWRPSLFSWCTTPGGCWLSLRAPPLSVLGSLGVRDPGVRAGAFACAYGCFSHGRLVAAGSVSGRPGGAGRSRGCLPGLRGRPCSALAYPTLGCGSSLWPLMAACAVAARWLGTWLCPLSCLPTGYSCTGLFSRPGLVKV